MSGQWARHHLLLVLTYRDAASNNLRDASELKLPLSLPHEAWMPRLRRRRTGGRADDSGGGPEEAGKKVRGPPATSEMPQHRAPA